MREQSAFFKAKGLTLDIIAWGLIIAKIFKWIDWPWWLVLAPLWIYLIIALIFYIALKAWAY